MKIGINGFGRIGRSVFRILDQTDEFDFVAINAITGNGLRIVCAHRTMHDRGLSQESDSDFCFTSNTSLH